MTKTKKPNQTVFADDMDKVLNALDQVSEALRSVDRLGKIKVIRAYIVACGLNAGPNHL